MPDGSITLGEWLHGAGGPDQYGSNTLHKCCGCLSAKRHEVTSAMIWDRQDRWDLWVTINVEAMLRAPASR